MVAGEGPDENPIREKVNSLNLLNNVLFVGYLDRSSELLDCYRACDVFVYASKVEKQSLVLLEAMTLGVPVVSTGESAKESFIENGKGAVIADDDIEHFTYAVIRLLLSSESQEELIEKGLECVKSWSAEICSYRLLDVYCEILNQNQIKIGNLGSLMEDAQ